MSQRHITSFFGGKDKRKADTLPSEACLSKNKKYDDEKRERRFIPSWTDQFPWVKYNHRTVLNQETLQHTMTIMTHGPQTLSQFNPRPALFEWIKNTPGSRHLLSMVKDGQFRESDKSLSSCQCASEASCSKNVD